MTIRQVGPVWSAANEGGAGGNAEADAAAAAAAAAEAAKAGTPKADGNGKEGDQNGSAAFDAEKTFAALPQDTREWLQKKGLDKDPVALAKSAHEQEKLIGGSIRVPGKDATPEEREEFLTKLGRPKTPDEYQLSAPKDLPEGLPYDGEREKVLRGLAHKLGLNNEQTAALRDAYVADEVTRFTGSAEATKAANTKKAETATAELVKLWGPLDGDTAAANFEIADKVFTETPGGPEMLAELKALGLVGPNKEILSVPLAKAFAAIGTALYTEDGILRGKPDVVGNPFDEKSTSFNLTKAMKIAKEDPAQARSLITAAGKKLSDFGLT